MRRITRPASLLLTLCVLLSPLAAVAQQQQGQSASLGELRGQIAQLEELDRDPGTPSDVKDINQTFLESRRAELRELLAGRSNALRSYLASSRAILRAEEIAKVEESIRGLEAELESLSSGAKAKAAHTDAALAASVSFSPREVTDAPVRLRAANVEAVGAIPAVGRTAQMPCPGDLNALITSVVLSTGGVTSTGVLQNTLEVALSVPLSLTNQPSDVRVVGVLLSIPTSHVKITAQAGATSTILTPSSPIITSRGSGRKLLLINLTSPIPDGATKVTVTLSDLAFECPSAAAPTLIGATSKTGDISTNETLKEADITAFNEANKAAAAKRSGDKNFRMGFTTAKGDGEDTDGAADLSFTRKFFGGGQNSGTLFDFFDQADVAFELKKATAEQADPRHLTLGLNLRKSFLVGRRLKSSDVAAGMTLTEARSHVRDQSWPRFFRVLQIKQGLSLEGEAFDFKTTNFVSDTHFELASIAKKLGSGFYNLNIFAGPEIGRNLAKPDAAATIGATAAQLDAVDWIARFKAGGEFTLRLLPSPTGENWGVELNLGYVNRHLFSSEVFTQETTEEGETTRKLVTIGKGNRAWRQADLKVFLFGNEDARYGVKLSYQRGSLPPAFTPTKGFQFGLVVESSDDTRGGEAANRP